MSKRYFRVILGKGNAFAENCYKAGYVGVDFGIKQDLQKDLSGERQDFGRKYSRVLKEEIGAKSKIAAGLACGAIWSVCKTLQDGDVVLSPRGDGHYMVGEVCGGYQYMPKLDLPHTRKVRWFSETLERARMGEKLKRSSGSILTTADLTPFGDEIDRLVGGRSAPLFVVNDATVEDPVNFAMEKHLEEFLVGNWARTELGGNYNIFKQDGEQVGEQFPTDTGPIDILAVSKDGKELLVVELKKGKASDAVVGQIQRYMGFVQDELAEEGQTVKGLIIALEDDLRVRRALSVTRNIEFRTYKVSFSLAKAA